MNESNRDIVAEDSMRASNADRDRTAEALRKHHSDGRLTDEEFQERYERSLAAKTLGELREIVADLPGERPRRERPRWPRYRYPFFLPPVLLIALVLAMIGRAYNGPPWHHYWFPWPLVLFLFLALRFGQFFQRRT